MDGDPWDPSVGITRTALDHVVNDAPNAQKWSIKKDHCLDDVMTDCDANRDRHLFVTAATKGTELVNS